jgi:hypothetical protein
MMPLNNPESSIREAKLLVESNRRSEIRLNANGGNSILLVCDPMFEKEYITHLIKLLPEESYTIIDLNKCLIDFIAQHKSELDELFNLLQSSTNEIFKAPADEESQDLFKEIISRIQLVFDNNRVPVLINSGALYGTCIDNIHIMEHELVMKAAFPVIILYPATKELNQLMFLSKRPASKYRCMIVE